MGKATIIVTLSQPYQKDVIYCMPVDDFTVKQFRPIDRCLNGGIGLLMGGLDVEQVEIVQRTRAEIARDIGNAIFKAMGEGDTFDGYTRAEDRAYRTPPTQAG